jgi:predicted ArsR family transcriptional regulator
MYNNLRVQKMQNKNLNEICDVLSVKSRFKILTLLQKTRKTYDANELAKEVGLHPNVVRYHLDHLERIGVVKSFIKRERKIGKPGKLYMFSGKRVKVEFPQRQFMLLSDLLCELCTRLLPRDELKQRALDLGREIGRKWMKQEEYRKNIKRWTIDECADSVINILSGLGLDPELLYVEKKGFSWQARNCIFYEESRKHPDFVCSFHIGILEGLAEQALGRVKLELPERFAIGDDVCRVIVERD